MFSSERFRQARELRGLTQKALAKRADVNQSTIAHIEAGTMEPPEAVVRAVALHTGLPITHFSQDDPPEFTFGSLLFRSRVAMLARERRAAYRWGQLAFELTEKLGRQLRQPPLSLPRIEEPPIEAARSMRSALGIGPDVPVGKLIRVLERHGVLVLASPVRADAHDAYSLWAGVNRERAVLVVVAGRPGDRVRFSVSHELRHLTCTARGTKVDIERDADDFASEFLMPAEAMRTILLPPITLTSLAHLKPQWGVSIQALIRRASDLEIITPRQYRYLMQQVGAHGWRTKEPIEIEVEKPRALRKMAEVLYGKSIDYVQLAVDTNISASIARRILDNYAIGASPEAAARPVKGATVLPMKRRSTLTPA